LKEFGNDILNQIKEGQNPALKIPIRSLSNVSWDGEKRMLKLGDRTLKRYLFHVAHSKRFMQTMLVAAFCKRLLKEGIHTSLRDLFYALKRTLPESKENTFETQAESDPIVVDLEVALDVLREQLHLNADVRGRVVGNVVIRDRGDRINLAKLGSGGLAISSNVEDVKFLKVDADYVLCIEKNAAFERLHEDKFWKRHRCILVTTQGQAARGCRRLLQRLSTEFNLPVYVFTDGDSYGWYIYSVIKYGSISLAHVSDRLGTPTAKFLGLTMTDIDKFNLHNFTIKAKEIDIKRAKELLRYPWFQHPAWQRELKLMIKQKIKAELESLSGRGLRFVTETYLPEKIASQDFLP
jgi:DNA topoisomerase-6 subunit A